MFRGKEEGDHMRGYTKPVVPFALLLPAPGTLMTLPGGVLLVLAAEWSPAQVAALAVGANSFFVETAPGFPSLELANALAAQAGVRLASPNWWREYTTP